jgi:hypothetical protein
MQRTFPPGLLAAPAAALVLPPFLLLPLFYRMPMAQLYKDWYEACLWLSPAVGAVVLGWILRLRSQGVATFRQPAVRAAVLLACLDLISPLLFYLILAIVAGH